MMSAKLKHVPILWILYALLSFPAFYFVYKYGHPNFGLNDFFSYYKLYENWNLKDVDAPFNMRLVSSFFVYLINKSGLHYNTEIAFDQINLSKQVFFNAVFFNYLCVVSTCVVIYFTLQREINNNLLSFFGGLLYLLGFGTLFYELMPLTDALSVLLFAISFNFYQKKSYWLIVPLVVLILQREYIFLALGLMTVMDYFSKRDKYYVHSFIVCTVCFFIYIVLRKTFFYTPKYDHQASTGYFLESLLSLKFPLGSYIRQTLMTLNIFIIYVLVIAYKGLKGMKFDKLRFWMILALLLQINVISVAAVFGNNTGRYFYILVPFIIFQLTKECQAILGASAEIKSDFLLKS